MAEVSLKVVAKVGPLSFEIESNAGDVLHHISASEFTQMILELSNYFGPADDPPELPKRHVIREREHAPPIQRGIPREDPRDEPSMTEAEIESRARIGGSSDPVLEKFKEAHPNG